MRFTELDKQKTERFFKDLIDLFDHGKHWIQKTDTDYQGNFCLRGGIRHITRSGSDAYAVRYFNREYRAMHAFEQLLEQFSNRLSIVAFNDKPGRKWGEVRKMILNVKREFLSDPAKYSSFHWVIRNYRPR